MVIAEGGSRLSSFASAVLRNCSQSVSLKLCVVLDGVVDVVRLSLVRIGRWSVQIPHCSGTVSQEISTSSEWSDKNTLSSLLHCLETLCR